MTNEKAIKLLHLLKEPNIRETNEALDMAMRALSQQETGKWIVREKTVLTCSECGAMVEEKYPFCPFCRAKMEGK